MNEKNLNEKYIIKNFDRKLIEILKTKKLNELSGIEEFDEGLGVKKVNFFKIFIKSIIFIIIFLITVSYIFFIIEYVKYQSYRKNNKEIIAFGELYQKDKKKKEEELKDLKNLSFNNISNLPEDRKNLMFNLLPSGSPLTREIFITSEFGTRVHPVSGVKKEHHGLDFRLDIGDEIIAPAIGKVIFAGKQGGYGEVVKIEHVYGFQTVYAHLNKIDVKVGEIVGKGKKIAEGGNTGVSTGPHLHYEVRYNDIPIDPSNFVNWNKQNFDIIFKNERSVPWQYFLTIMGKN